MKATRVIAGDIGGTNTRLLLCEVEGGQVRTLAEAQVPSRTSARFEDIIEKFLDNNSNSYCAFGVFGIAGVVQEGVCRATNLPWIVDAKQIRKSLGIKSVRLLNDLEANAWGVFTLKNDEFEILLPGKGGQQGNAALISAGTGLGEAGLYWDGERHRPFASEGGHVEFAPQTEEQVELWRHLSQMYGGHVSVERVLSGPGLKSIYEFLLKGENIKSSPSTLDAISLGDPSAAIAQAGLNQTDPTASRALELFAQIYGAAAGNLALKLVATAGVFLGGGIAPKILPVLKTKAFAEGFLNKGRMRSLLQEIPVKVILNEQTALQGALSCALGMAGVQVK